MRAFRRNVLVSTRGYAGKRLPHNPLISLNIPWSYSCCYKKLYFNQKMAAQWMNWYFIAIPPLMTARQLIWHSCPAHPWIPWIDSYTQHNCPCEHSSKLQLSIRFTPSRCLDVRQDWYPMYYPEGMKARVSPVQSIEPHRILAPTRDLNREPLGPQSRVVTTILPLHTILCINPQMAAQYYGSITRWQHNFIFQSPDGSTFYISVTRWQPNIMGQSIDGSTIILFIQQMAAQ